MAKKQKKNCEELTSLDALDASAFVADAKSAETTEQSAPQPAVVKVDAPKPEAPKSEPPKPEAPTLAQFAELQKEVAVLGRQVQILNSQALKEPVRRQALNQRIDNVAHHLEKLAALETQLHGVEAELERLTAPGIAKRTGMAIAKGWAWCTSPVRKAASSMKGSYQQWLDDMKQRHAVAKAEREAREAERAAMEEAVRQEQEEKIKQLQEEAEQLRKQIAQQQQPEQPEQPEQAQPPEPPPAPVPAGA